MNDCHDYIWVSRDVLSIDKLDEIKSQVLALEPEIIRTYGSCDKGKKYFGKGSPTTHLYMFYNIFTIDSLFEPLFKVIEKTLVENRYYDSSLEYGIQSWINIHRKNENLGWHGHGPPGRNAFHGYFCVDSEPSKTLYQIPYMSECLDLEISNTNNSLVFGRSEGDKHMVTEWAEEFPRITIAFDIVPVKMLKTNHDHWLPIGGAFALRLL